MNGQGKKKNSIITNRWRIYPTLEKYKKLKWLISGVDWDLTQANGFVLDGPNPIISSCVCAWPTLSGPVDLFNMVSEQ